MPPKINIDDTPGAETYWAAKRGIETAQLLQTKLTHCSDTDGEDVSSLMLKTTKYFEEIADRTMKLYVG